MADSAEKGRTYRVKDGALSWNTHDNGKRVEALEGYGSASAEIRVRCDCCGDTTRVSIRDLES